MDTINNKSIMCMISVDSFISLMPNNSGKKIKEKKK